MAESVVIAIVHNGSAALVVSDERPLIDQLGHVAEFLGDATWTAVPIPRGRSARDVLRTVDTTRMAPEWEEAG